MHQQLSVDLSGPFMSKKLGIFQYISATLILHPLYTTLALLDMNT